MTLRGDVVESQIEGVDAVAAGGVAALPDGFAVEHQEPALARGCAHAGGFTHDGPVKLREPAGVVRRLGERPVGAEQEADAVGAGAFLFPHEQQQEVDGKRFSVEMTQHGQHRDDAAAIVVRAQTTDDVGIRARVIRVACIAASRRHSVEMGD